MFDPIVLACGDDEVAGTFYANVSKKVRIERSEHWIEPTDVLCVDEIEIGRWKDAINARLAVDTYFDPGHERLKGALRLADPRGADPSNSRS